MLGLVGGLAGQLPQITFDTSNESFLHHSDPTLVAYNEFRRQFGRDDLIIIAIEPENVFDQKFLKKLTDFHDDLQTQVPHVEDITSMVNARNTRGEEDVLIVEDLLEHSGYHELNDQWALLGTVGWEDWSAFEDVNISTDRGSQKIPRDWKDTWKFAAGVHFRPVEKWLLQLGFSYDTSPVDLDDRTLICPLTVRFATPPESSTSGVTACPPAHSSFMPITARLK